MATEKQKSTSKKKDTSKGKVSKGSQQHGDIPQETQKEKEKAARKGK